MTDTKLCRALQEIVGADHVRINEPMKLHTTFRIGGPADFFVAPESEEEISALVKLLSAWRIPYTVIGNGSNLLVGDLGFRGVIIQLFSSFSKIHIEGNRIHAEAGALLSKLAASAFEASLTGIEFAGGIPGTLGGASVMNAGAYGGELKDVLSSLTVITADGERRDIPAAEMGFSYRSSRVSTEGWIAVAAELELKRGDKNDIKARMDDFKERRVTRQPIEYPSAGSTFKRPEGFFAGKLIMDAGLKGVCVGGAQVSEKHCGFIINKGDATASDVVKLIENIEHKVEEMYHVKLEPEVRFLGDF